MWTDTLCGRRRWIVVAVISTTSVIGVGQATDFMRPQVVLSDAEPVALPSIEPDYGHVRGAGDVAVVLEPIPPRPDDRGSMITRCLTPKAMPRVVEAKLELARKEIEAARAAGTLRIDPTALADVVYTDDDAAVIKAQRLEALMSQPRVVDALDGIGRPVEPMAPGIFTELERQKLDSLRSGATDLDAKGEER